MERLPKMIAALLVREWIKLRRLFAVPFVLVLASVIYAAQNIGGFRSQHGAALQYADYVSKETVPFELLQSALILGGVVLALVQYLPDCQNKRLRLVFQLPASAGLSLGVMLAAGFAACAALLAFAWCTLALVLGGYGFVPELKGPMLGALLPWGTGMWVAYCATAASVADPSWVRKALYASAGAMFVALAAPVAGYGVGPGLAVKAVWALLWAGVVAAAALRVREGS